MKTSLIIGAAALALGLAACQKTDAYSYKLYHFAVSAKS